MVGVQIKQYLNVTKHFAYSTMFKRKRNRLYVIRIRVNKLGVKLMTCAKTSMKTTCAGCLQRGLKINMECCLCDVAEEDHKKTKKATWTQL